MRCPLLESWRARFAAARQNAGLVQPGFRITHDPTFETAEVRVEVRAGNEPELAGRIEDLAWSAREGKLRGLFEALSSK